MSIPAMSRRHLLAASLALPVPAGAVAAARCATTADAALLAAAQQIPLLQAQIAAEASGKDGAYEPVFELEDVIAFTPAATVQGAIIKLRWLKDELTVMLGDDDEDRRTQACCRQVIALLEQKVAR